MNTNKPQDTRMQAAKIVLAGTMPQADNSDHWSKAVRAFKDNAASPAFAEALVRDLPRTEKFINALIAEKESTQADEPISHFLSHHHLFNRLSRASKEEKILPWIESLETSAQRARVLGSQPWLRNILRATYKKPETIDSISRLLDNLNTDDLKIIFFIKNNHMRDAIQSYMPRDKAREWLDKIAPKA